MGIVRRHTIYGLQLHTDEMGGAAMLGGVKGVMAETQTEVRNDTSSGEVWPTHLAMAAQNCQANFRSTDIATALTLIPFPCLAITGAVNPGLNLYGYKLQEGGLRAAGGAHRKYNIKEGIIIPLRLTSDHQGDAILEYLGIFTWDGTNDPIVISDAQAVPTNGTDLARFSIGKATIGNILIDHITQWEIDFGLIAEAEGADSDKWPTHVALQEGQPRLRLRGRDITWLGSTRVPLEGLSGTHANTKLYLRKRAQGTVSGYVANNVASHISVTADGLAYIDPVFEGSADRNPPAEIALEMPLKKTDANDPLVFNLATTIT